MSLNAAWEIKFNQLKCTNLNVYYSIFLNGTMIFLLPLTYITPFLLYSMFWVWSLFAWNMCLFVEEM